MTINTGLEEDFQIAAQTHASDDDATGIKWPTWRRSIWLYFLHYIKEIMLADKVEILVRRRLAALGRHYGEAVRLVVLLLVDGEDVRAMQLVQLRTGLATLARA